MSVVSGFYLTLCKHVEVYTTWLGGECVFSDKIVHQSFHFSHPIYISHRMVAFLVWRQTNIGSRLIPENGNSKFCDSESNSYWMGKGTIHFYAVIKVTSIYIYHGKICLWNYGISKWYCVVLYRERFQFDGIIEH